MGDEISIRAAQPDDAPILSELLAQLGYPATSDEIPARLAAVNEFPRALALVALRDENVVGLVTSHIIPSIQAAEPVALLTTLVVAASHRGKGIGSRLVSAAERWAADHGAAKVSVTSGAHRVESHLFYENRNYVRSGFRFTKTVHDLPEATVGNAS